MKAMAEETGGIHRIAKSAKALQAVYEEIDQLETSEIESIRYIAYDERFESYALAAVILLLIEISLGCTVFRKIP